MTDEFPTDAIDVTLRYVAALLACGFIIVGVKKWLPMAEARRAVLVSLWPRFAVWVLAAFLFLSGTGFGLLLLGAALAVLGWQAAREVAAVARSAALAADGRLSSIAAAAIVLAALVAGGRGLTGALIVALLGAAAAGIVRTREDLAATFAAIAGKVFSILYVAVPLGLLVLLRGRADGFATVAWLLLVVILTDLLGTLGDLVFGRAPVTPRLLPGRSVAGLIAAFVGALLGGILMHGAILGAPLALFVLGSLFVGAAVVLGDALAAALKRSANVATFGRALAASGGVMDRIGGLLVAAPVAYGIVALMH